MTCQRTIIITVKEW